MSETKYVGRAGEKLDYALKEFHVNVDSKICADFGSSVGGFVDCLLKHGANKVYAIEKGYGVLDWRLRNNSRVVVMERTNAMHVILPEKVDILTIDASWTKQKNILPNAVRQINEQGIIITLIKPHYEADRSLLRKGKLTNEQADRVMKTVAESFPQFGLIVRGIVQSPIVGDKAGNIEYLACLSPK